MRMRRGGGTGIFVLVRCGWLVRLIGAGGRVLVLRSRSIGGRPGGGFMMVRRRIAGRLRRGSLVLVSAFCMLGVFFRWWVGLLRGMSVRFIVTRAFSRVGFR